MGYHGNAYVRTISVHNVNPWYCIFYFTGIEMGDIPQGDPTKGAKVFKQRCAQCHTTEAVSIFKTGKTCLFLIPAHHP